MSVEISRQTIQVNGLPIHSLLDGSLTLDAG
jgi:hypothetical protein